MSRMENAVARLDAAVARVERAAANSKSAGTDLELAAELRQAREDYAALKDKSDGAAHRLDLAIVRLNGMLGEAAE
ncbi:MAG: hypothetical protein KAT39_11530 [Alphaproteobacteria bacterium]|nr:hypothetical protein [Alphaproteobacteria bacterium]